MIQIEADALTVSAPAVGFPSLRFTFAVKFPGSQVLYKAATPFERALADVDAERLIDTYAEAIIDVWDPYAISLKNLPYLAWGLGVNYWNDSWSEGTKRNWTARQWEFKALRGTAGGIAMVLDFTGRDVTPFGYKMISVTAPPQQVFSGATLTPTEREQWLSSLPQLHLFRVQESWNAPAAKKFYGGSAPDDRLHSYRFCLGGEEVGDTTGASTPSTAIQRLMRRARYVVNGVETDIKVESIGSYWQLHLNGVAGYSIFNDRPIWHRPREFGPVPVKEPSRFFIPSEAWRRIVTIQADSALPWRASVGPTLTPISTTPERVAVAGLRGRSVFCDLPCRPVPLRAFYVPTTAPLRIFERYAVTDGSPGPQPTRPAVQFMGVGRYGFPKYHAWVKVSVGGRRSRWAVTDGINLRKFFIPHDPRPLQRVREAVAAGERLTDKVLLDIGPRSRFVAGGTPVLADIDRVVVGQAHADS